MGNGAADYPKKAKLTFQVRGSGPVLLQHDANQPVVNDQTYCSRHKLTLQLGCWTPQHLSELLLTLSLQKLQLFA